MMKVKICGLMREEDIHTMNRWQPDYAGFVFAESKRKITREQAMRLRLLLRPETKGVGVFVNARIREIRSLVENHIIDVVQLHGHENEEYIKELKQNIPCPVIKAVRVKEYIQVQEALKSKADYLLFDAYSEAGMGGMGKVFDWTLLKDVKRPYFLAGGLTPGNVAVAGRICRPYGVDVSSGVETMGKKDAEKIRTFILAAQSGNKEDIDESKNENQIR